MKEKKAVRKTKTEKKEAQERRESVKPRRRGDQEIVKVPCLTMWMC